MSRPRTRLGRWLEWHDLRAHTLGPLWLRIPEKARWRVVSVLNKSKRYCWSDLVQAALGYPEDDPCDLRLPTAGGLRCRTECGWFSTISGDHHGPHDCQCYCGKFTFHATKSGPGASRVEVHR